MTKDEFIDLKISEFHDGIEEAIVSSRPIELRRALRVFALEVERETRHKAAELARRFSNDIHNL